MSKQWSVANPVYPGYFADPAVIRAGGDYWAYGTGDRRQDDGREFPVLRSSDLVHWTYAGGALVPPADRFTAYWAPEVAQRDGRFYLYYSAGTNHDDTTHRLRVALAENPAGPFIDAGPVAMPAPYTDAFCIDAHPFCDPADGKWYLFFATDFFNGRVGTGTAAFALGDDMRSAASSPSIVLRASADWMIYQRNRTLYSKVWPAWHTIEGPYVWPHAGKYYCFYSGGNWQTPQYGVGCGVAERPLGKYMDPWSANGPGVLSGGDTGLIGPGHNCIVLGPDERSEFIVYHAWNAERTARRMCIDPLIWTEQGPRRQRREIR